jgi:hypothetical protein
MAVIVGPVLVLVGILIFTETVVALEDLVLGAVLFLAALHAVRFTPYFALAACAFLAPWRPLRTESLRPTPLTLPFAAVLVTALLVGPYVSPGTPQVGGPSGNPVAATQFLKQESGRVFTTYWWGDYLVYEGIPVFVDGRTDLYFGTDILGTYMNVADLAIDPDTAFRLWDVRWVMWDKGDALATYLYHDPRWRVALSAGDAVVFELTGRW